MAFSAGPPGGARRIGTSLAEINIIPLVDVVLVLLLIFMLTAPMMYRHRRQPAEGRFEANGRRGTHGADRHQGPVALPERSPPAGHGTRAGTPSSVRQSDRQDPLPEGRRRAFLRRGRGDDGPRPSRGHR